MKRVLAVLISLSILSACSTQFDKSMRAGKDALRSGDYETAVSNFEDSLIEEPRNEDARILLSNSLDKLREQQAAQQFNEYITEIKPHLVKYETIYLKYNDSYFKNAPKLIRLEEITDKENLSTILTDITKIGLKYEDNEGLYETHRTLQTSIVNLIKCINRESVLARYGFIADYIRFQDDIKRLSDLNN